MPVKRAVEATLRAEELHRQAAISADLVGISVGRDGAPVRGSGVFISGAGDTSGRLIARRLETGTVYSDGGIPPGTPDCISGGVFVIHGAFADSVRNRGPVTTYGANDMVLDNWVSWTGGLKVPSSGPHRSRPWHIQFLCRESRSSAIVAAATDLTDTAPAQTNQRLQQLADTLDLGVAP
jgi:hypothetical protein